MKLTKIFLLGALTVAGLGMSSCSDKGYWNEYSEKAAEVYSFGSSAYNYTFTPTTLQDTVTVALTRSDASKDETLSLFASGDTAYLAAPESVTFPAGKASVDVPVVIKNISIGDELELELTFQEVVGETEVKTVVAPEAYMQNGKIVDPKDIDPSQPVDTIEAETIEVGGDAIYNVETSAAGTAGTVVTVKLDYTWVSAGSAQCFSNWVGNYSDAVGIRVPIQKAQESTTLYRLESPYWYMEPDYADEGYHFTFHVNATAFQPASAFFYSGEFNSTYGTDYFMYYPRYMSVSRSGNEFSIAGYMLYYNATYTGLYSAGTEYFDFVWDDEYPF